MRPAPALSFAVFSELFIKPVLAQKRCLVAIFTSLVALGVAQGLFLLMIKGFIQALFEAPTTETMALAELLPPSVSSFWPQLADLTVAASTIAVIVPLVVLVAGLCKAWASYVYQLNQQALALYLAKSYRDKLFSSLLYLPYGAIKARPPGEWMSIIMNDVMFLQTRFTDITAGLLRDGIMVVSCYVILFIVHWPTALLLIVVSPAIALGMGRTGKRIAYFAEAFQRELARLASAVLDVRARFDFIRAQKGEGREQKRFDLMNNHYYRFMRRSLMVRSIFAPLLEFLGFALFALLVFVIGQGLWGADLTPAVMLQFFVALGLLLKPLKGIGEQLASYQETKGSLAASLAMISELENSKKAADTISNSGLQLGSSSPSSLTTKVTITSIKAGWGRDVRFAAEQLSLEPGRAYAIIGPSGAGKSTLLKTLAGLVTPQAWEGSLSWPEVTALVSMVSQEPFLFDDTLRTNLTYGLSQQNLPSDEEIWQVLQRVNIDREVEALPQRLETRVRAIGSNLSGGQVQRLVIARALLRRKPWLLLDEATSAVDPLSERDITLRLIALCRDMQETLVAVTHRLQWLEAYDEVWFVEHGRLLLRGPHRSLLSDVRYREFCGENVAEKAGTDESPHDTFGR